VAEEFAFRASRWGWPRKFTLTNALELRELRLWMARAMSSLPVPVSPRMRTVESGGRQFRVPEDFCNALLLPTSSSNMEVSSISCRRATFSWKSCSLSVLNFGESVFEAFRER